MKLFRHRMVVLVIALLIPTLNACAPARTGDLFSSGSKKPQPTKRTVAANGRAEVITEAFATDDCGSVSRGGFVWFTSAADFNNWIIPMEPRKAELIKQRVPFDEQGALLIDFGSLPTPGYGIKLMANQLQIDGNKAIVQVDLIKPSASAKKRAQVLSHPCALFVLPRLGYTTLEVQTALGDVLASFENE